MPAFSITNYIEIYNQAGITPPKIIAISEIERLFYMALLQAIPAPSIRHGVSVAWVDRDNLSPEQKMAANQLIESAKAKLFFDLTVDPQLEASNALLASPIIVKINKAACYNGNTKITGGAGTRIISNHRTLTGNYTLTGGDIKITYPNYLTCNPSTPLDPVAADFSLSCWLKGNGKSSYLLTTAQGGNWQFYVKWNYNGVLSFTLASVNVQVALANATWYFCQFMKVGNTLSLYVDSVLRASNTAGATLTAYRGVILGDPTNTTQDILLNNITFQIGGGISPILVIPSRE